MAAPRIGVVNHVRQTIVRRLRLTRLLAGFKEVSILELDHETSAPACGDRAEQAGRVIACLTIFAAENGKARRRGAKGLARRRQQPRALIAIERRINVINVLQQFLVEGADTAASG